ncbi:MAG: hypothetical protein GY847_14465 [Proteobacteria bacterium]|nr:hypothetical protein [Pseudomonadota bacterium]
MRLYIKGRPIPAPRQTRQDRWKQRPVVMEYRKYRDAVSDAFELSDDKIPPTPWKISYHFGIAGHKGMDLDNLVKSVNDALVYHGHVPDDNHFYINYFEAESVQMCPGCPSRKKRKSGGYHPDCGAIKKCADGFTDIVIESSDE